MTGWVRDQRRICSSGIRLPFGWSQDKEEEKEGQNLRACSSDTLQSRHETLVCSLEDVPVPGLSQLSTVNLQKDYYQLCSQQPHRNLGNVCPCSSTQGWHALWSSSMLRQGISAQQINTATTNGINYSLMELCLVSQTKSII